MTDLIGVVDDAALQIKVQLVETGPQGPPGPMGTTNYNLLENRPSIQSIELIGNKTFEELGLSAMTPNEIENLI